MRLTGSAPQMHPPLRGCTLPGLPCEPVFVDRAALMRTAAILSVGSREGQNVRGWVHNGNRQNARGVHSFSIGARLVGQNTTIFLIRRLPLCNQGVHFLFFNNIMSSSLQGGWVHNENMEIIAQSHTIAHFPATVRHIFHNTFSKDTPHF